MPLRHFWRSHWRGPWPPCPLSAYATATGGLPSLRTPLLHAPVTWNLEYTADLYSNLCSGLQMTFSAPECILAIQGRSESSKVDHFGTNRKRVYDFLLAFIVTTVLSCTISEIRHLIGQDCLSLQPVSFGATHSRAQHRWMLLSMKRCATFCHSIFMSTAAYFCTSTVLTFRL